MSSPVVTLPRRPNAQQEELISCIEAEIRLFRELPKQVQHDESARVLVRWSAQYPGLYQIAERRIQEVPC